ncbi:MAG: hypothetical protein GWO38_27150, partial [Phycisphaerae bacterium]|nr:hypothetical protein [Phycisphaerae bacterium]NIP55069.1 hypothetical protein [Phycisphaerae bacterium]NIX31204.1 hypothetical protein [Phycisphaerae bacterium]
MQKIEAGSLYDALFKFESRFQKRSAYPIHKKLKFPKGGSEDIYDWLLARLSIADDARILDAGSGVGYGAVRIAQHSKNVQIVGLSISECEVAESNRVAE